VRALEHGTAAAVQQRLRQQGVLLVAIGLPAAVALGVLAGPLAQLIFGPTYRPAATQLLPVISLGVLLGGFKAFYADLAFQLAHRTGWLVRIALPSAALNIALNVLWIPRYGVLGAAWATVAAFALGLALSIGFGRRFFTLAWPWRDWAAVVVATAAFGLALWPARASAGIIELICGVLGAGLVYLLLVLLFDAGSARTSLRHLARPRKRVTQ
jgi:O-antigen/teichoic acid export membrane protein